MKLVTWNINGMNARHERVLQWITEHRPDVLCLQELKQEDHKFPTEPYRALGYEVATHGQKAWNGVAILSRAPLEHVVRGFEDGVDDPQSRAIAATTFGVRVHNVYVPNGQALDSPKFVYKLDWLRRLEAHLAARIVREAPAVLCGDFNIVPTDEDVWDPAAWRGQVLCTDDERAALARLQALGLEDVLRRLHPTGAIFTWWDYRMLAFPKGHGLRIDHVLATPALAARVASVEVERGARKGESPSDHAPVVATFSE